MSILDKHKVFLIVGRTASGKSTLSKEVAKNMGLKILKSYTDRPMRDGETIEEADHTFVSPDYADHLLKNEDIIAYTDSIGDGYRRFATLNQLMESDIYIIDPVGVEYLKNNLLSKTDNIEFIEVYIRVPYTNIKDHAKRRGDDFKAFYDRYKEESIQFDKYEKDKTFHYHILNDKSINESVNDLIRIIGKELNK